jgi:hypothetical protein
MLSHHFLLGDPNNWGPVTQTIEGMGWRFREDRRWWAGVRGTTCCLVDTGSWGYYVFRVHIAGEQFAKLLEPEAHYDRTLEASTPWGAWQAWCKDRIAQEASMVTQALDGFAKLKGALGSMG